MRADGSSPDRTQLNISPGIGGGEWGDIDRVSYGLVTGRVNHVPQGLFGILDATAFRVPVPQEDQLLLLPGPQPTHTLSVHLKEAIERDSYGNATIRYIVHAYKQASAAKHLDDSEAEETFVQHDDLVLVTSVIHNVAESKQRRHVGQDSAAPHRVAFVRDKHLLFISSDGIVQHDGVLILIRRGEVILWSKQEKIWLMRIK